MLRSIRNNALTLPEPEAVRSALLAAARFLLTALTAWALSRAVLVTLAPMAGLAPFAMALFAAGLTAGLNPAALLAGCLLGAINGGPERFNLALPVGCAAILTGGLLWNLASPGLGRLRSALRRAPDIQARSPNDAVTAAALAGIGVLMPGLIYAGGELWPSALALAAALSALAAAPFLRAGLRVRPASRFLLSEERAGLFLLLCMLSAGLCAVWPPLALLLSLSAATLTAPAGALVGLGTGTAMLLITGDARYAAVLGACGAAIQLCRRLPRPLRAAVPACGALAGALYVGLPAGEVAALCAAPPLAMLLPEAVRARLLRWSGPPAEACDPDRLAAILRGQSARRLQSMSAAFEALAEGYLTPAALPDEQALMTRLRGLLCADCPGYADCWNGDGNRAAHLLCDLVAQAVEWSETDMSAGLFEDGATPDLSRRCRRGRQLPDRVGEALEDFARRRRSEIKRGGENRLISAQFLQAARLIDGLAREQARPIRLRDRQARRAAAVLERGGIPLSDALLISGARTELVLTLREGRWTDALAGDAADRLTRAFGRVYAPQAAGGRTMRFTRLPRLTAKLGAGSVSRDADGPSGDSCVTAMLDDDRLLALICDGMGSGEAAARESGAAARLLGRFLSAGAALPLAVETVNALMVGSAAEDMFSTVDLMLVDLSTGMADFLKLAACPALIAREGSVRRVEGGRLPLGILEKVEPAATQARLIPGDTVLLASDGVMDAADPDALEALLLTPQDDMNALCEAVLDLAGQAAGAHRDDMTVVCVRIEERV